jgi:hypothetical protein
LRRLFAGMKAVKFDYVGEQVRMSAPGELHCSSATTRGRNQMMMTLSLAGGSETRHLGY